MSRDERVATLLHEAAESVNVRSSMPRGLRWRVRLRQGSIVGVTLLSIAAIGIVATSVPMERDVAPADRAEKVMPLTSGKMNGVGWQMEIRRGTNRFGRYERVCVQAAGQSHCRSTSDLAFGEVNVALGYVDELDAAVVIVRCPPGCNGVLLREVAGASWAALVASEGDDWSFFYRFFEGKEVEGVLTVDGADAPMLDFHVKVRGDTVRTGVGIASTEFPELRAFPGDKRVVESSPDFGGYSVVMRRTDTDVCLHIGDLYRCRDDAATDTPVRLWILHPFPCEREDDCSPGYKAVVIAGEVDPEVARVGIRDDVGTSYVQVGEPFGPGLFSTYAYARPGDELGLVAFDSSGDEVDSVSVTVPGSP